METLNSVTTDCRGLSTLNNCFLAKYLEHTYVMITSLKKSLPQKAKTSNGQRAQHEAGAQATAQKTKLRAQHEAGTQATARKTKNEKRKKNIRCRIKVPCTHGLPPTVVIHECRVVWTVCYQPANQQPFSTSSAAFVST